MCTLFPEFRSRFVTDLCLDFSCNLWQLHEDIFEHYPPQNQKEIIEENSLRRQTSLKKKIKRVSQTKSNHDGFEKIILKKDSGEETDVELTIDESNQLMDDGQSGPYCILYARD